MPTVTDKDFCNDFFHFQFSNQNRTISDSKNAFIANDQSSSCSQTRQADPTLAPYFVLPDVQDTFSSMSISAMSHFSTQTPKNFLLSHTTHTHRETPNRSWQRNCSQSNISVIITNAFQQLNEVSVRWILARLLMHYNFHTIFFNSVTNYYSLTKDDPFSFRFAESTNTERQTIIHVLTFHNLCLTIKWWSHNMWSISLNRVSLPSQFLYSTVLVQLLLQYFENVVAQTLSTRPKPI